MIKGINHVGVVVESIDKTVNFLKRTMNAKVLETVRFEEAGQVSCLVEFGNSRYELMEPIGDDGVVASFLAKRGEGFHHVSLLSDNFDGDCAHFESEGVRIISRSASGGMRYAFTHPKTSGGILYEIAGE